MIGGKSSSSGRLTTVALVVGWIVLLCLGGALVYFGFFRPTGRPAGPTATPALPTLAVTKSLATAAPTLTPTSRPTATPQPTATPIPPSPTPAVAKVQVTEEVNVRSGPGTEYTRLGSLTGGSEARVTGRSGNWWQIEYNGGAGWVFGDIVTAVNTSGVPEVQAPPRPTAAPTAIPAPTAVPPTATPSSGAAPPSQTRGLVVNSYRVEGAPGPYSQGGSGAEIWFDIDITNSSGNEIPYLALGTWVQETGQFQKSYFATPPDYPSFMPGQHFQHRDHIFIKGAGSYRLWLAIEFKDEVSVLLYGPVNVTIN